MSKQQIKVSEVLELLEQGKSRKEIGEYFGLNGVEVKTLFQHPELKGKKAKKQMPFVIIDDINEVIEEDNSEKEELDIPLEEESTFPEWDN